MQALVSILCLFIMVAAQPQLLPWRKLEKPSSDQGLQSDLLQHMLVGYISSFGSMPITSLSTFRSNVETIWRHNQLYAQNKTSFEMAVNKFSSLSPAMYKKLLGYNINRQRRNADIPRHAYVKLAASIQVPPSWDWRKHSYVTPVKDQGNCGSCWAFSTTGAIEGQYKRVSNVLVSLSEQQLVDCSSAYDNAGCNGGLMDNAFAYVKKVGGIESEADYPYISGKTGDENDNCSFDKSKIIAHITGYVDIDMGDEDALMQALYTQGPISVAIDASHSSFMSYHSGIYDDPMCSNDDKSLDHAVLLVGYGIDKGIPYWLIKNSWGTSWGEAGYVRIKRSNNLCGVATASSYPLIGRPERG